MISTGWMCLFTWAKILHAAIVSYDVTIFVFLYTIIE